MNIFFTCTYFGLVKIIAVYEDILYDSYNWKIITIHCCVIEALYYRSPPPKVQSNLTLLSMRRLMPRN